MVASNGHGQKLAGLGLALCAGLISATTECKTSIGGVTYDLSALTRPADAPYLIQDAHDSSTNFTFNICGDVATSVLPGDEWTFVPSKTSVPAYQLQKSVETAYELSQSASQGWNFSLYGRSQSFSSVSVRAMSNFRIGKDCIC